MSVIDLIIRIKNGYMAKNESISSPYSKYREAMLIKLKELGYIKGFDIQGEINKKINIDLLYIAGSPAVTDFKIFSTPGKRVYTTYKDIKRVRGGMGHALITSSKGILTGTQAKKARLGGELLVNIW